MPIGDRPQEIARSPDVQADGPPFVQACFLLTDYAYDLLSTLLKWKSAFDEASGKLILLVAPGDSEQSGSLYKRLRTAARERTDQSASTEYREAFQRMAGTAPAQIHLDGDIAWGIAARLGVEAKQLPCVVWRTYPDMRPALVTRIKPRWCQDESARNSFAQAFVRWLRRGQYRTAMDGNHSVGTLRRQFKTHLLELTARIDRAVGLKGRKRKASASSRITAQLCFDALEDEVLKRPRPARLKVHREGEVTLTRLTQVQLFYLTAFLFLGEKCRSESRRWRIVDESDLAARLTAWSKASLRRFSGRPPDKPEHRIAKEWRRFVARMHDRISTGGWFDEKVYEDRDAGRRSYRQALGVAALRMDSDQRAWLQSTLRRLTGQV